MDAKTAYECFVGGITPAEFVAPFESLSAAIDQLITEKWWEGTGQVAPVNLGELIHQYVQDDFISRY